jgi:hypothetical protein
LEASEIDFPANSSPLGTEDRPIPLVMEPTAGSFCQLEASAGSYGSRCVLPELDQSGRICLSPLQHDRQMFDQNHEGESRFDPGGTGLASTTMVANHHGTSLATPADHSSRDSIALGPIRQSSPSSGARFPPVSRLEIVRERFKARGVSEKVVELLVGGNLETTSACYQSAWKRWLSWCARRDQDPLSASLIVVLEFLTELHKSGKAYRSINVPRSMLSAILEIIEGYDVGKDHLVIKLMLGIFNFNPPKPSTKYNGFWDIGTVLWKVLDRTLPYHSRIFRFFP